MNVDFESVKLSVDPSEAIDLYYAMKREIEHFIETHWKNCPDSFERGSAQKLDLLRQLSRVIGQEDFATTLAGFRAKLKKDRQ